MSDDYQALEIGKLALNIKELRRKKASLEESLVRTCAELKAAEDLYAETLGFSFPEEKPQVQKPAQPAARPPIVIRPVAPLLQRGVDPRRARVTMEMREEGRKMWMNNVPSEKIAEHMGCSEHNVRYHIATNWSKGLP